MATVLMRDFLYSYMCYVRPMYVQSIHVCREPIVLGRLRLENFKVSLYKKKDRNELRISQTPRMVMISHSLFLSPPLPRGEMVMEGLGGGEMVMKG